MPKLSVIVPVYNTKKYLIQCLDSILNQTMEDFELIIIDDGSTDGSTDICLKYSKLDNRVKFLSQENMGVSIARNRALDIASGDYKGFVDSDDYISADMFEHLLVLAERNNADIVSCNLKFIDENGNDYLNIKNKFLGGGIKILKGAECVRDYIKNYSMAAACCNKVIRSDIFKSIRYPIDIKYGEDYYVNYCLAKKSAIIVCSSEEKYFYRKSRFGSATSNEFKYIEDRIKAYRLVQDDLDTKYKDLSHIHLKNFVRLYLMKFIKTSAKYKENKKEIKKTITYMRKYLFLFFRYDNLTYKLRILYLAACISPELGAMIVRIYLAYTGNILK